MPAVPYDSSSWVEASIVPISASVYTYYSINIDGFSITPPAASTATPRDYSAAAQSIIVDSGTTLMYLPDAVAEYVASLFVPRELPICSAARWRDGSWTDVFHQHG